MSNIHPSGFRVKSMLKCFIITSAISIASLMQVSLLDNPVSNTAQMEVLDVLGKPPNRSVDEATHSLP